MKEIRSRSIWVLLKMCAILSFSLIMLSCTNWGDLDELASKIDSISSTHGVQEQIGQVISRNDINEHIEKILVIGKIESEVFEFAASIDAEMVPISGCYIMRFFEYRDKLDRYLCFEQGRLESSILFAYIDI